MHSPISSKHHNSHHKTKHDTNVVPKYINYDLILWLSVPCYGTLFKRQKFLFNSSTVTIPYRFSSQQLVTGLAVPTPSHSDPVRGCNVSPSSPGHCKLNNSSILKMPADLLNKSLRLLNEPFSFRNGMRMLSSLWYFDSSLRLLKYLLRYAGEGGSLTYR